MAMLRKVQLEDKANARYEKLSGGQKQRFSIASTLVNQPRVIFLDEPTAGVDPINRREFWELIYGMAKQGVTVLVTTHYMDEAELCERVGFNSQGRVVALDSPARLKQTQMRGRVLEISSPLPDLVMSVLKAMQENNDLPLDEVALYGTKIHAVIPQGEQYRQEIKKILENENIPITSLACIEPTLEDVFISSVSAVRATI
jgi:ABC-2 type transport system ATP-binding protein